QLNAEITTTLLSLVDAVRQTLATIETTGHEGEADYTPLMASLSRLQEGPGVAPEETPAAAAEAPAVSPARDEDVAAMAACADTEPPQEGQGILLPGAVQAPMVAGLAPPQPAARAPSVADTSIRVDVGLLDMLMDQVGELVLARNRIMQFATDQENRTLLTAYQRLDTITSELQAGVMKTRMQPIGTIWNKFPRVVRDLARECGKQVTLTMDGQETELDRTLIEAIRDPLTHLVRNAVDHGIETPEARLQAGKSEAGTLLLRAFHEGGQVNIEISDDGAGIDPERIVRKATERKLITTQQATQMSPREILHLIFTPGFSTAETVTNVSGRGVGMDVVKSNIERINGTIDVQSQVGKWTAIKIKSPLTLAIIPALMVRCARDRYAIPQVSLVELVRLEGEAAYTKIEIIHGAPVYRLRGNLLPLVYLRRELMVDEGPSNGDGDADDHTVNIVVLQADERQFGLVVDSVHDTEEIVVKPLSKQLKDLAVYAGATIMGDGQVALILDVLGLAQRAHVLSERRVAQRAHVLSERREAIQMDALTQAQGPLHEVQTLLLFASAAGERMALPLSRVTRLEKFSRTDVEHAGHREVVQYWGQIMPLLHISQVLAMGGPWALPGNGDRAAAEKDTLEVVVLTNQERSVGLVVDTILDIVEDRFAVQDLRSREGVIGTAVVQGHVTELLDIDAIIRIMDPMLLAQLTSAGVEG
ncbi:MAG: chemotaxis protein CheW, partial [Candidatus Tectomicrobia bacterium]